jgi:hypothetical protein
VISSKLRLIVAVLLMFLVVVVDSVSKIMSLMIDAAFIAGVVAVLWPMAKDFWQTPQQ